MEYKDYIERMSHHKTDDNDFFLKLGERIIPTNVFWGLRSDNDIEVDQKYIKLSKESIDRYHPEKIDVSDFWKVASKHFPFISISAGENKENSIQNSIDIQMIWRTLPTIDWLFSKNKYPHILEIGPGYGNVMKYMKRKKYSLKNYKAIDVCPLIKSKKVLKCDGKTIPDIIPNELDMVYSINVFQHLSRNQRLSYYEQIYKKLKTDGLFVVSMNMLSEENKKEEKLWGFRDRNDRRYTQFFGMFTEVDSYEEFENDMKGKFTISPLKTDQGNYFSFACFKI